MIWVLEPSCVGLLCVVLILLFGSGRFLGKWCEGWFGLAFCWKCAKGWESRMKPRTRWLEGVAKGTRVCVELLFAVCGVRKVSVCVFCWNTGRFSVGENGIAEAVQYLFRYDRRRKVRWGVG